jgi:hypothetical protein
MTRAIAWGLWLAIVGSFLGVRDTVQPADVSLWLRGPR